MRILVMSDSHGDELSCRLALEKHSDAGVIIHLGDGEENLSFLENEKNISEIYRLRGNAFASSLFGFPELIIEEIEGKKFYMTHGFRERVKYSLSELIKNARREGADIVLFGHTHEQFCAYEDGLYIMNPGSIRAGEYAVIDITSAGIVLLPMKL